MIKYRKYYITQRLYRSSILFVLFNLFTITNSMLNISHVYIFRPSSLRVKNTDIGYRYRISICLRVKNGRCYTSCSDLSTVLTNQKSRKYLWISTLVGFLSTKFLPREGSDGMSITSSASLSRKLACFPNSFRFFW